MGSTALFAIFVLFEAAIGGAGTLRNRYQPGITRPKTGFDETILTDAARFAMFFSALGNKSKRRTWYDWMKGTNGASAKGGGFVDYFGRRDEKLPKTV